MTKLAKSYDSQDPDGMVKAELLEPQCPNTKAIVAGYGGLTSGSPPGTGW
jgi:hypothetical protein